MCTAACGCSVRCHQHDQVSHCLQADGCQKRSLQPMVAKAVIGCNVMVLAVGACKKAKVCWLGAAEAPRGDECDNMNSTTAYG